MNARSGASEPRLDPPPAVRKIAARLTEAGHETWCVGGAVRDALLGHAHADWDLATAATPRRSARCSVAPCRTASSSALWVCSTAAASCTRSRRSDATCSTTAGMPWWSTASRSTTTSRGATSRSTRSRSRRRRANCGIRSTGRQTWSGASCALLASRPRGWRRIGFARSARSALRGGSGSRSTRRRGTRSPNRRRSFPDCRASASRQEIEKTMDQVRRPSRSLLLWRRSGAFDVADPRTGQRRPMLPSPPRTASACRTRRDGRSWRWRDRGTA